MYCPISEEQVDSVVCEPCGTKKIDCLTLGILTQIKEQLCTLNGHELHDAQ